MTTEEVAAFLDRILVKNENLSAEIDAKLEELERRLVNQFTNLIQFSTFF